MHRSERRTPKRIENPVVDFIALELADISLHPAEAEKKSTSDTQVFAGSHICAHNGTPFELAVTLFKTPKSEGDASTGKKSVDAGEDYLFTMKGKDGQEGMTAECSFIDWGPGYRLVKTSIVRKNRDVLPRGLGIEMVRKMWAFIQTQADEQQMPLLHDVERFLELSDTPMTEEQWNRLFVPVLTEHGYTRLADDHWKKLYKPRATQST